MSKVYVAAKFIDNDQVKEVYKELRACGHTVSFDWTGHTKEDATAEVKSRWADECMVGVRDCDTLIAVFVNERHQRGAMIEIGAALGQGKPVIIVGTMESSSVMLCHPLVTRVDSIKHAIDLVNYMTLKATELVDAYGPDWEYCAAAVNRNLARVKLERLLQPTTDNKTLVAKRKQLFPHGHANCHDCEAFVAQVERLRVLSTISSHLWKRRAMFDYDGKLTKDEKQCCASDLSITSPKWAELMMELSSKEVAHGTADNS